MHPTQLSSHAGLGCCDLPFSTAVEANLDIFSRWMRLLEKSFRRRRRSTSDEGRTEIKRLKRCMFSLATATSSIKRRVTPVAFVLWPAPLPDPFLDPLPRFFSMTSCIDWMYGLTVDVVFCGSLTRGFVTAFAGGLAAGGFLPCFATDALITSMYPVRFERELNSMKSEMTWWVGQMPHEDQARVVLYLCKLRRARRGKRRR